MPKIGQNTEKSSGDLRRLAVTQTSVKDQFMLMWKAATTTSTTNNNNSSSRSSSSSGGGVGDSDQSIK